MRLTEVQIHDWPDAYHVWEGDKRLGIVNKRILRRWQANKEITQEVWVAHDANFFSLNGEFTSCVAAALALPRGALKRTVDDFS